MFNGLIFMSAFIPLSEFSDSNVMKKYGLKPDAETLDIVSTAAAQKEVTGLTVLNNFSAKFSI